MAIDGTLHCRPHDAYMPVLGDSVVVASDTSATHDITRANGQTIDKDTLHRAALMEVEGALGDVTTASEIMHLPLR